MVIMRALLRNALPGNPRRRRPHAGAGGFTMVELLMTMLLLTIVLTGLAALQVGTIHRVTAARKANEATRLCQTIVERYRFAASPTYPVDTVNTWVLQSNPATGGSTWNADANGDGPFTVHEYVEDVPVGTQTHKVITVKCSWKSQDKADPSAADTYQTYYVAMSLRRVF
jgi:Tfp pilus assembly protein PilV